jgi:hypothetical protein
MADLASAERRRGYLYRDDPSTDYLDHRQPGTAGPRRVRQDELRSAFSDGWSITSIEAAEFERNQSGPGIPIAQAWLAAIQRIKRA